MSLLEQYKEPSFRKREKAIDKKYVSKRKRIQRVVKRSWVRAF